MTDPVFVIDSQRRIVDHNHAASAYVDDDSKRPPLSAVSIDGFEQVFTRRDGGTETTEVTTTRRDGDRTRTVTYDLRNPLAVINGRIELATETGNLDHLETAQDSVSRMETLIDDLLTLAREGQSIDETETVDIGELSRAAWEHVDGEGTLTVTIKKRVSADPSRLQEVLSGESSKPTAGRSGWLKPILAVPGSKSLTCMRWSNASIGSHRSAESAAGHLRFSGCPSHLGV